MVFCQFYLLFSKKILSEVVSWMITKYESNNSKYYKTQLFQNPQCKKMTLQKQMSNNPGPASPSGRPEEIICAPDP